MEASIATFIPATAIAVLSILFLFFRFYRENSKYLAELEFRLRHRTIAHNQTKARIAVTQTRIEQLKKENARLEKEIIQKNETKETPLRVPNPSAHFELEKLELEISSIQEILNSDIKHHLSHYVDEVDGLRSRLKKAKETTAELTRQQFESLNKNDVA
ncbi:MAG: hypothetical protein AAF203_09095 [Pseudomonadota bacterium]